MMGFLRPKTPAAVETPAGPSPAEIRAQEETKIEAENLAAIQEQESRRQKLRGRLLATEDDEGEIRRKQLFGQ